MKSFLVSITLFLSLGNILLMDVSASNMDNNDVYTKIEQASTSNIQIIVQSLSEMENLWPQNPEAYFRSANHAARILGGALTNSDAKQSLTNLFDRILDKKSPANDEQAIAYFDLKSKIILYYFNFNEVRNDKSRLLAIAGFIGEVRSRMIPNYANQGTGYPGREILRQAGVMHANSITNAVLKQAYEKAVIDNKQDLIMNDLQRTLRNADISFHLLHNCSRVSSADPKNENFFKEIISSAHLSKEEGRKIGGGIGVSHLPESGKTNDLGTTENTIKP